MPGFCSEEVNHTDAAKRIFEKRAGTPERIKALNLENVRDASDGCVRGSVLPLGEKQTALSYATAVTTLTAFVAWPYIVAIIFFISFVSRAALACFIGLLSTLLIPATLLASDVTCSYIMHTWQEYFHFGWTMEQTPGTVDNVIFAEFPHGVFPLGPILAAGPCAIYFPGRKVFALAASVLFYLPGYKQFMTWMGGLPASRGNLARLLHMGSVAVIVGGIAEMFMVKKHREEIVLRGRKGLIRTAIETGTPIVPCYFLGNSQILSFGPPFLKALSRRMRTSVGLVFGRWGLPIPRQVPIQLVSGKPLYPKMPKTTPEEPGYEKELSHLVEDLQERLADETEALYKRHRHIQPGWKSRPIIIH